MLGKLKSELLDGTGEAGMVKKRSSYSTPHSSDANANVAVNWKMGKQKKENRTTKNENYTVCSHLHCALFIFLCLFFFATWLGTVSLATTNMRRK